MRTIFTIGKLEFKTLFYSPIAWLLLIFFTVYNCKGLIDTLMYQTLPGNGGMTAYALLIKGDFFLSLEKNLYLYIPLLTMGVMSREYSSGSIKLLTSSPISTTQTILGKYISLLLYWLTLMFIILLIVLGCYFTLGSMDWAVIFTSMLGIYLLACTFSAIGLFMSCLTQYQVVAAVSTFITLGVLNYMGTMWQDIPVARDVSMFLDMSRHVAPLLQGLIVSRDVVYFLTMSVVLLGLSVLYLQDMMASRPPMIKASRYTSLILVLLIIGYFASSRPLTFYYDVTPNKSNTISEKGQQLLKQLNGPVTITSYVNLMGREVFVGMPSSRNWNRDFWDEYIRFAPQIELRNINYYDTSHLDEIFLRKNVMGWPLKKIAEKLADDRGFDFNDYMPPAQVNKLIDQSKTDQELVWVVEYNGRQAMLRAYDDPDHYPLEQEVLTAVTQLLTSPAKIVLLTGHNERSADKDGDRDYKFLLKGMRFRKSLINQGFDISYQSPDTAISAAVTVLVIADPTANYNPKEISNIQAYIAKGGNLLITTEPGRQAVIAPLLNILGVQLTNGTLVQDHPTESQDLIFVQPANNIPSPDGYFNFGADMGLAMPGAAGLSYTPNTNFTVQPLFTVNQADTYNRPGELKLDTGKVHYDPGRGDTRSDVPVVLALRRNVGSKDQRILVTGDADFLNSATVKKSFDGEHVANFDFAIQVFKWFADGKYPVDLVTPQAQQPGGISQPNRPVTAKDMKLFKEVYYGLIPVLLLLAGGILLIARKRR